MNVFEPIEVSELVSVPGVGEMERVELRSPDGEVLEVQYRWPSDIEPPVGGPAAGAECRAVVETEPSRI